MSFKVVAACVLAKDERGLIRHVYEGGVIEWLSPEQEKHFLDEGLVVKIGSSRRKTRADKAEGESDGGSDPAAEPAADDRPPRVATKDVLVDWLDTHGSYDRDELEAQTKDQLWELIDATE